MRKSVPMLLLAIFLCPSQGWAGRPITLGDQFRIQRFTAVQVSPDGKWLLVGTTAFTGANNGKEKRLYLVARNREAPAVEIEVKGGGDNPIFSPDSKSLYFVNDRDGTPQIWRRDLVTKQEVKVTQVTTGVSDVAVSPDGKWLAFLSDVFPKCKDEACNRAMAEQTKSTPSKAREFDRLFVRHWQSWLDKEAHLLVISAQGGAAKDLTIAPFPVPTLRFRQPIDFTFTHDSKALIYTSKPLTEAAYSTNSDLYEVKLTGGAPRRLAQGPGDEASPRCSPDGRLIGFRSQKRAGFEADQWRLKVFDRKSGRVSEIRLVQGTKPDLSVDEFSWGPDSATLYFSAQHLGRSTLYSVKSSGGTPSPLSQDLNIGDFAVAQDGSVDFVASTSALPPEVYHLDRHGGMPMAKTEFNTKLLKELTLHRYEELWSEGADGTRIHGWMAKPPRFRANEKYPLLVFIHGGPQQAWLDDFGSIRWSPQLYVARGYVALLANPRGSTSFGQSYTDAVSGDWGGRPYDDIMRLVEEAAKLPYVDGSRVCALGASYGGFMVNWIQGHTQRFRCLVSHAGVFDQRSMYYQTEELWFPEWEFGGRPWEKPDLFEKFSPSAYTGHFATPELLTHGELDFRVPVGEGLGMFTALQRRGVASRLLLFPDEGHWIQKPANLERWLGSIWSWLDRYLKPGPTG